MMLENKNIIRVAYLNMHGQSNFSQAKQIQLEDFIKTNKVDIAHLQETEICDEVFSNCHFINSNFNILCNNASNKFGTSSLVKNEFCAENVQNDTQGRAIVFNIGELTFGNLYGPSGTDAHSRSEREKFFAEVLPQLLTSRKSTGCIGGDLNCIIDKIDATNHPEAKMSNSLKRVTQAFNLKDSFRSIYPKVMAYSRYYENARATGATRIDRQYHWGEIYIKDVKYLPLAFSDHHSLVVTMILPTPFSKLICPVSYPPFKVKDEVIYDEQFQQNLSHEMAGWQRIKAFGMDTMVWWEVVVKPGIRVLAKQRGKQMRKESRAQLNLLLLRQAYLNKKVKEGETRFLVELASIHNLIHRWYENRCEKVKIQSRKAEYQDSEKVTIYHHEIHKKLIRKSSILKLQTSEGIIEGHDRCAAYLEKEVKDLLLTEAGLDHTAQDTLLDDVHPCFSEEDNAALCAPPTLRDVKETINNSNLHAAPGCDGIPSLLYKVCWETMGEPLVEVMNEIFNCKPLSPSQKTSLMVFGTKPKKSNSILPKDKRRISLLNSDFKTASGLEAGRLKKMLTRTLSPLQLVAGGDRLIHHGINLARDAIWAAGARRQGCGILDTDLIAGFDYMTLEWCLKVLEKKGASSDFIKRLKHLYENNLSVVVVNGIHGAAVKNVRLTLRQGDLPSMDLFCYGIDPLLCRLNRTLRGILISSLPVHGPSLMGTPPPPPLEQRFKVIGYADDTKPAITTMEEFITVDQSLALFEKASGCRVHRDPQSKKCKFLAIGKWKNTLKQEDIPCTYMTMADHLDMVGVTLTADWTKTRKENGEALQTKVKNTVQPWKAGKFLPITQRGWSINSFALSKVWFRAKSINLRISDIQSIISCCKSWLYQDLLVKPEEVILFRPASYGGLGMHSIKYKALAGFITTFLQTAANPSYQTSLLHNTLYRKHVLQEDVVGAPIQLPPYFSEELFEIIRIAMSELPLNITKYSEKDWTRYLTEKYVTKKAAPDGEDDNNGQDDHDTRKFIPSKAESANPTVDWEMSWSLARQKGLPPKLSSFTWKMLLNLLCSQERLVRLGMANSAMCKLCNQEDGSLQHELIFCSWNDNLGLKLLSALEEYAPSLTAESLLLLSLPELEQEKKLPLTLLIAITLNHIWEERFRNRRPQLYKVRSELEQTIILMRTTRLLNAAETLNTMTSIMFQ